MKILLQTGTINPSNEITKSKKATSVPSNMPIDGDVTIVIGDCISSYKKKLSRFKSDAMKRVKQFYQTEKIHKVKEVLSNKALLVSREKSEEQRLREERRKEMEYITSDRFGKGWSKTFHIKF